MSEEQVKNNGHSQIGGGLTQVGNDAQVPLEYKQFIEHVVVEAVRYIGTKKQSIEKLGKKFLDIVGGHRRAWRELTDFESVWGNYLKLGEIRNSTLSNIIYKDANIAFQFLKKLTELVKKQSSRMGEDMRWRRLVDMETIVGFPKTEDKLPATATLKEWLTDYVVINYEPDWWEQQFLETFQLFSRPQRSNTLWNLDEFIAKRWLWSTSGSSSASKLTLDNEPVKTKFGVAVSLTDNELYQIIEGTTHDKITSFRKADEKGMKTRLIANAPLSSYLVLSHIAWTLENVIMTGVPILGNFDLAIPQVESIIDDIRTGVEQVPLDESAWDQNFPRNAWLGWIKFLRRFPTLSKSVYIFENEIFDHMEWTDDGMKGVWKTGMPSGLKVTSMMNSWVNYIKQRNFPGFERGLAGGDDSYMVYKGDYTLEDFEDYFKGYGAEVNSTKNWKSKYATEFLKHLYYKKGVTGYPARIYSSLIWVRDVRFTDPQSKLTELASLWKTFYDRMGIPFDEQRVTTDIARAVSHKLQGFGKSKAKEWLHTPSALGGFGMAPFNMEWRWIFKTEGEEKYYTGALIDIPSFKFITSTTYERIKFEWHPNAEYRIGPPGRLPPVTTMEEWEARINNRDIPVHHKWKKYYGETVPIPTASGISRTFVKKIAKVHGLNAYYNIVGGNTNTILNRLVNAELALLSLARAYLLRRGIKIALW
jgi:hypothetical protein